MSEALTPHLTRLQYVRGYLNALQQEQNNINYNFEANETYQISGETLGDALDQSKTMLNLPARQLQPMVALKYKPVVRDSTTASLSLSQEELAFAYSAADVLIPVIRYNYPQLMETMLFKGFIAGQLAQSKRNQNVPPFPGRGNAPPPDNIPGGIPPANLPGRRDAANDPRSDDDDSGDDDPQDPRGRARASGNNDTGQPGAGQTGRKDQPIHGYFGGNDALRGDRNRENNKFFFGGKNTGPSRNTGRMDMDSDEDSDDEHSIPFTSNTLETVRRSKNSGSNNSSSISSNNSFMDEFDDDVSIRVGDVHPGEFGFVQGNNPMYNPENGRFNIRIPIWTGKRGRDEDEDNNDRSQQRLRRGDGPGIMTGKRKIEEIIGRSSKRVQFGTGIVRGRGLYFPAGENHYIDMNKLDKGFINVKNSKFKQVGKQEVAGGSLVAAVKEVLHGKNPRAEDVEKLNDSERGYLNKLAKVTGDGNFHVPVKNLTEEEKEYHQFEVMKGEIIAGNDNEKMIKDFKRLLLKLMSTHRINKTKAQEILVQLAALGY